MKKKCFFEKLSAKVRSQSGTAAVLTLSLILVLMALGTISLAASVLNVRMSGRTLEWSEEFYQLDSEAEDLVLKIDNILIEVEKDARDYVINRFDRLSSSELTLYMSNTYNMNLSGAQEYFNQYYQYDWTYTDPLDPSIRTEYTMMDYADHFDDGSLAAISKAYSLDSSLSPAEAYSADLKLYISELFDRVYFHMLARKFEELNITDTDFQNHRIVLKGDDADFGVPETDPTQRCTYRYWNIQPGLGGMSLSSLWIHITPSDDTLGMYISVGDSSGRDPKKVNVELNVIRPDYTAIEKTIKTPIFGNPIWTNALTVRGGITVKSGSSARILGDVYASDVYGIGGVSVEEGANASIRGNVYTAGNLQIVDEPTTNGGNLRVLTKATDSDSTTVSYNNKIKIYNNDEYLFAREYRDSISNFNDYTPDKGAGVQNMPFIFKDAVDTGNVYCESVLVEEGVSGAVLTVDGNLWTRDDVQMDGQYSVINIGVVTQTNPAGPKIPRYNYIGLNGESDVTDPNASSSVINNFPHGSDGVSNNSIIKMNSNFIVPGVAFYNFFTFPNPSTILNDFYKSGESITARTTNPVPTISAYVYNGVGAHKVYENDLREEFDLVDDETIANQKVNALIDYLERLYNDTGETVYTNIYTDITYPEGYVAGVAMVQPNIGSSAKAYTHNPNPSSFANSLTAASANLTAFTELSNGATSNFALMNLFSAKTKKLGTYDASDLYHPVTNPTTDVCDFDDFVDETIPVASSEIIRKSSGSTLNVTGSMSGIVYCDGNLTINGTPGSEFKGAIICKGNLTITGNVRIVYDESVILKKLKKSANVRLFFKRGEMGEKLDDLIETSTSSGKRVLNRYKILSWKEVAA